MNCNFFRVFCGTIRTKILKNNIWLLLIIALMLAGCASSGNISKSDEGGEVSESRLITDIQVTDASDSFNVLIRGNQLLPYTSDKESSPLAVVLSFSETSLNLGEHEISSSGNDMISSVKAAELENEDSAKVTILLVKDAAYEITQKDTDITISFAKTAKAADSVSEQKAGTLPPLRISPAPISDRKRPDFASGGISDFAEVSNGVSSLVPATRVHSVYAAKLEDSLKVFVGANGAITNYKSFTIANPPSIIFDIFNIQSPYKHEKTVSVNTRWVRQIRYYGYPDRLRVILDTTTAYLSAFSAYPIDNGLLIHVGTNTGYVSRLPGMRKAISTSDMSNPTSVSHRLPAGASRATQLQAVYATQTKDGIVVTVRGDGAITNYKPSVIDNPATIVFDIFNIRSYKKEHSFPVDTQWVKRVRHESYPDKLRVYIDTQPRYLSAFSASPNKNGLEIYVGTPDARFREPDFRMAHGTGTRQYEKSQAVSPPVDYTHPSWITRVDFLSEDAGKSKLVISTTKPVIYDLNEKSSEDRTKQLELKLFNTKIPKHRQRPYVAEPSESAVAKITPVDMPRNTSVFLMNLYESVPYFAEQNNNLLTIYFEATSTPEPVKEFSEPLLMAGAENKEDVPGTVKVPVVSSLPDIPPAGDMGGNTGISGLPSIPEPGEPSAAAQPVPAGADSGTGLSDSGVPPQTEPGEYTGTETDMGIENLWKEPEKKYTGEKIALDFFETDIKNVFRILKEVSGKNFAIDNDVKGKVTLSLEHPVPWDQVLDLVLRMNQLGSTLEGNIIRIATVKTLEKEEEARQKKILEAQSLKEKKKDLEPLFTEYIAINYSDAASEIQPHLEKILTPKRGTLSVDKRTNMIIMTDTEEKLKQAKEIVEKLDRVTPQVLIEARIVEANTSFSKAIGTEWGSELGIQSDNDNAGTGPQRGYNVLGGTYGSDIAVNFPDITSYGTLGFNFTRLAGTPLLLNAKLMAMESKGGGKIVSSPKILTLDNKAATISQGYEYPYQTVDDEGNISTSFKQIDLNLEVTPHITPDNRISMKITIDKNDVYEQTDEGPALSTKKATTELLVNDGDTIVIGGITQSNEASTKYGIPILSKIPVLGWLFKSKTDSLTKVELLIFITPKIVQLEQKRAQY